MRHRKNEEAELKQQDQEEGGTRKQSTKPHKRPEGDRRPHARRGGGTQGTETCGTRRKKIAQGGTRNRKQRSTTACEAAPRSDQGTAETASGPRDLKNEKVLGRKPPRQMDNSASPCPRALQLLIQNRPDGASTRCLGEKQICPQAPNFLRSPEGMGRSAHLSPIITNRKPPGQRVSRSNKSILVRAAGC